MTKQTPRTSSPAETIRRYLDSHDGSVMVPFKNLLTTWQLEDPNPEMRAAMGRELTAAGVEVDRSLRDIGESDQVRLTVQGNGANDAPPWAPGEAEEEGAPTPPAATRLDDETNRAESERRSQRKPLAISAIVLALAAGVGVGGYFLGRNSGEDLDAARAAGARQGQREGAARGAERGYGQGFRRGRRQGYRHSYGPAYDRAYNAELRKAGFEPVRNPSGKK